MSNEKTLAAKEAPRLNQLFDNLVGTLRDFIRENRVTHEEYRRAVAFLTEAGAKGEIPLLFDVFVEVTVDEVDNNGRPGTRTTVEGPFYLPNSPVLKSPCVLPHRKDEPGPVLFLSGSVRGQDGRPLPGAVVDMWQSDSDGRYSHFDIPAETARNNLRARVIADDQGGFEVQTWMPGAYEIPKHGPTGAVLTAMGRHHWRPAHLHMKVEHEGHRTLTTQLFLKNDPWIDSDVVVGAVKQSLIVDPVKHEDPAELRARTLTKPFYTQSFDFVLDSSARR
jgi:catechol 1,2-dioxygenase